MEDDTIKKIVITGAAAESMESLEKNDLNIGIKKGGKTRKGKTVSENGTMLIKKLDGAGMSPGTMDQLSSTRAPGFDGVVKPYEPITQGFQKIGGKPPQEQRVVLAKSQKVKKVFLAPAPPKKESAVPNKKRKTMKRVSVDSMGIRLKKAKTIRKKSLKTKIEDIKEELVSGGLVKKDSKAPESVLRQMHSDFMVLKKRAL